MRRVQRHILQFRSGLPESTDSAESATYLSEPRSGCPPGPLLADIYQRCVARWRRMLFWMLQRVRVLDGLVTTTPR